MTQNTPLAGPVVGSDITKAASSPLNPGQNIAAEGFFEFLFTEEKEMKIIGPGGTGKTHLMSHMIDAIMPRYFEMCKLMGMKPEFDEVQMTALTNKAAEVLSAGTSRHVSTIHSFMNLTVKDDYSTGQSRISMTRSWKVHERVILFIDEAFMIDSPLLAYIREGTQNCKIVYVGDNAQLGPVMEASSPIDALNIRTYTLTQPMRATNPDMLALHDQLRATVYSGIFQPIRIVPGVIDHLDNDAMDLALQAHFHTQNPGSRILAYTNKRVQDYNAYIRQIRQLPVMFTVGEELINNSAVRLPGDMLRVEEAVTIVNLGATIQMPIEQDVMLDVQMADIATSIGNIHKDVPLPMDYNHFTELKKYYTRTKNWNRKYYLQNTFPDLRQRDAATVYKAQGSTHDDVYIDLGDISNCRNPDQVARQLYVAGTRPRERIFLFGTLADKYGGLII